ncbi:MAG: SRPBCC domain-containing protein [Bacteroidota bacterium]
MRKSIELSITYDYPIADVWAAMTTAEAMSEWLMPCDFQPKLGHQFQFRTKPAPGFDGIINCEVLEIDEPHRLTFSWSGGSLENTRVSFELTAKGDKTRLDFVHSGFEGLMNRLIVRNILGNGWKHRILVKFLPQFLSK